MSSRTKPAALLLVLAAAPVAAAEVRLPSVFGDHMVLQRLSDVPVWGRAEPGEAVHVRGSWGESVRVAADGDGRWTARLRTPKPGGPHTLEVHGTNRIVFEDVLIGEVWLASGQSNMEMPMGDVGPGYRGVLDAEAEIAAASHPTIRLFDVPNVHAVRPQADCGGAWEVCGPESVYTFSSTAYFFGRELSRALDVPVGIIGANWGGTVVEAWTSEAGVRASGEFWDELALIEFERLYPGQMERDFYEDLRGWWESATASDPGSSDGWERPELDDSDWDEQALPGAWEATLGEFDGFVWYRKRVTLPAGWVGERLELSLGPIDDMDTAWFDGAAVGAVQTIGAWQTPRRYAVPESLVGARDAVVAVRVLDTGGQGGLHGAPEDMWLALEDGASERLSLAGNWRRRAGRSMGQLDAWPRKEGMRPNTPTALFNGMIAPLAPFRLAGVIWYQGESNRLRAAQYRELFPRLIADWREVFERPELPFYYAQIAPYDYGGDVGQAAELREAQAMALRVPHTGMAVTMDIGNPADIHPANKQEVGRRLALLALARTYGREVVDSGPMFSGHVVQGDAVRISFDRAHGGLVASDGGPLTCFEVAGADRVFHPAEARIEGASVLVRSPEVPEPVAVRFAWGAKDEPNLANGAGLPAPSFRTDDWVRPGAEGED